MSLGLGELCCSGNDTKKSVTQVDIADWYSADAWVTHKNTVFRNDCLCHRPFTCLSANKVLLPSPPPLLTATTERYNGIYKLSIIFSFSFLRILAPMLTCVKIIMPECAAPVNRQTRQTSFLSFLRRCLLSIHASRPMLLLRLHHIIHLSRCPKRIEQVLLFCVFG